MKLRDHKSLFFKIYECIVALNYNYCIIFCNCSITKITALFYRCEIEYDNDFDDTFKHT